MREDHIKDVVEGAAVHEVVKAKTVSIYLDTIDGCDTGIDRRSDAVREQAFIGREPVAAVDVVSNTLDYVLALVRDQHDYLRGGTMMTRSSPGTEMIRSIAGTGIQRLYAGMRMRTSVM